MAQISDEALRKVGCAARWLTRQLLVDIDARATASAKSLQQVNAQITVSEREKRLLELTQTELASYPPETPVYVGVGKMYDV